MHKFKSACLYCREEDVHYERDGVRHDVALTFLSEVSVELELTAKLLADEYHLLKGSWLTGLLLGEFHGRFNQLILKVRYCFIKFKYNMAKSSTIINRNCDKENRKPYIVKKKPF